MESFPQFDEIYVVSDLHLGGVPGFQIFGSGKELGALINHIRDRPASRVAIVINGDSVDFLAEPGARYFDPKGANDKLDRIVGDASFKPVFDALKEFLDRVNRHLIITLGNHDVELALPWVRSHFVELLAGNSDAARGRITLSMDGTGYACSVGGASVLCIHGNEVDTWNVTDYERLRRSARDCVQGRSMEDWTPNAGTKLVIDVMNGIKRTYPFVDLLKPEVEAVVPVLLALDPGQLPKLSRIMAVATRLGWDTVRRMTGFLSAGEAPEPGFVAIDRQAEEESASTAAIEHLLNRTFAHQDDSHAASESRELMNEVENMFNKRTDPLALVAPGRSAEMLGGFSAAWDWISGRPRNEVLREALEKLKEDRTFDVRNADSPYRRIDELVGSGFDYVITGHTHQERVLARSRGRGMYFNTGTWVALMNFSEKQLFSATEFASLFTVLESSRTIAALELYPGLVERKPAVVCITQEGGVVQALLKRVTLPGDGVLSLTEVQGEQVKS
jgi:UDP-2,3-diacylglucosamine pyrophosphatase LpxH